MDISQRWPGSYIELSFSILPRFSGASSSCTLDTRGSTRPNLLLQILAQIVKLLYFRNWNLLVHSLQIVMVFSCIMAFLINYYVFLNTTLNSALTQTICGNLKVCSACPLNLRVTTWKVASIIFIKCSSNLSSWFCWFRTFLLLESDGYSLVDFHSTW